MSSGNLILPSTTFDNLFERARHVNFTSLSLLVAIFVTVSGNWTFFEKALSVYSVGNDFSFLISLGISLLCSVLFVISSFSLLLPIRWAATITLLLAAVIAYYTDLYGTIINKEIILSMLESNIGEAKDLLNLNLAARLLFCFAVPSFLILRGAKHYQTRNWLRERFKSIKLMLLALVILAVNIFLFSDHYASYIREHKYFRYYSNPAYGLYSLGKLLAGNSTPGASDHFTLLSHYAKSIHSAEQRNLVILVVGETARADHFSLNGYQRDTNPLLSQQNHLISFSEVSSCATVTAVSVPCMFSLFPRDDFDLSEARNTENALDVLHKAGVSVLWRDNNSDSKGVADRVRYEDFRNKENNPACDGECRDIGMLAGLDQYIETHSGDILIVLHQMGSHGPAYYKRYPKEYALYQPSCATSELSECSEQEIVNAYDNSIRYTDYFLSEVIGFLKRYDSDFQTSMLYVSDHGESLGEHGMYLHGMPYAFAPESQTHVPFLFWSGSQSNIDSMETAKHSRESFSHDELKATLFDLFGVNSDAEQYFAGHHTILRKRQT